ncbi:MAG TPA: hypothetical protein VFH94_23315 [Streptomyces sp.]|nr:hypothetical protein [Streptomyces sp.]
MTDTPDDTPTVGTKTSLAAADEAEKISSELYDLIGIKGKLSKTGAGVTECGDKDPEKFFKTFHPSSLVPASVDQLDGVMERLKKELPEHGWKVVEYGVDNSKNKNLNLTADNDAKKFSVKIVRQLEGKTPSLSLMVVSGCYQVPDGEKVERF